MHTGKRILSSLTRGLPRASSSSIPIRMSSSVQRDQHRPRISWTGGKLHDIDVSPLTRVAPPVSSETKSILSEQEPRLFVFVHGTGFCKEVWLPLVRHMQVNQSSDSNIHILLVDLCGHGDSEELEIVPKYHNCVVFGGNVMQAYDEYCSKSGISFENIVGVGHSIGGATLLYNATVSPSMYSDLILFEPVIMPLDHVPKRGHPLQLSAERKRSTFKTKVEAADWWRGRGAFELWRDEALQVFTEHALKPDGEGGFTLKCRREYEADLYLFVSPFIYELSAVESNVKLLQSVERKIIPSERYTDIVLSQLKRHQGLSFIDGCSHFGPMEKPEEIYKFLPLGTDFGAKL